MSMALRPSRSKAWQEQKCNTCQLSLLTEGGRGTCSNLLTCRGSVQRSVSRASLIMGEDIKSWPALSTQLDAGLSGAGTHEPLPPLRCRRLRALTHALTYAGWERFPYSCWVGEDVKSWPALSTQLRDVQVQAPQSPRDLTNAVYITYRSVAVSFIESSNHLALLGSYEGGRWLADP
jgi:hypothetical protein